MIKTFRHKGLRRFFEEGRVAVIQPAHAKKLRMLLSALDTATEIDDMDVPGFGLHPLKGDAEGRSERGMGGFGERQLALNF